MPKDEASVSDSMIYANLTNRSKVTKIGSTSSNSQEQEKKSSFATFFEQFKTRLIEISARSHSASSTKEEKAAAAVVEISDIEKTLLFLKHDDLILLEIGHIDELSLLQDERMLVN